MKHGHSVAEIVERITDQYHYSYLRDWIYGGIDGVVTTFAVVSGVVGAEFPIIVIVVLGFANLVADGFSMAASNFLGTRAEEEQYKYYKDFEEKQTKLIPEGEREEIKQIFVKKGFKGENLNRIVEHITSNKNLWIDTMLREEYGLPVKIRSAYKASICTFLSFFLCGLIPVLPFVFGLSYSFLISCVSACLVFFLIGSIKGIWSVKSWLKSGLQTLFVGVIAAGLAYLVGFLFSFNI